MNATAEKAYKAYQRALKADMNRVVRNAPEHYTDMKRRHARIAALKEKYEAALRCDKLTP